MRKLATIQEITRLSPITGADQIEVADVLGWKVVVKKGEHKIGDKIVYCEIDSILPDKPEFEFLRARKFRIKTVRLKGQISQGIVFPLAVLPDVNVELGFDVTEVMGIAQWQPTIPACIAGEVKGPFPSFIAKTDETRVQTLQDVLRRYKGTKCYITEKVDGSSATFYLKDGEFGVCSRNLDLKETEGNAFWQFAREIKLEEKMREHCIGCLKNMALQGELVGNGIQKNNLKIIGRKILFFNVFSIDDFKYRDYHDFVKMCKILGVETVPVIQDNFELTDNIDDLVKLSIGMSVVNPKVWREGIVIRPIKEVVDLGMSSYFNNGRLSFKVVNPEYLLSVGE
jgi:RNA ligase (TIGR02306 family)